MLFAKKLWQFIKNKKTESAENQDCIHLEEIWHSKGKLEVSKDS